METLVRGTVWTSAIVKLDRGHMHEKVALLEIDVYVVGACERKLDKIEN